MAGDISFKKTKEVEGSLSKTNSKRSDSWRRSLLHLDVQGPNYTLDKIFNNVLNDAEKANKEIYEFLKNNEISIIKYLNNKNLHNQLKDHSDDIDAKEQFMWHLANYARVKENIDVAQWCDDQAKHLNAKKKDFAIPHWLQEDHPSNLHNEVPGNDQQGMSPAIPGEPKGNSTEQVGDQGKLANQNSDKAVDGTITSDNGGRRDTTNRKFRDRMKQGLTGMWKMLAKGADGLAKSADLLGKAIWHEAKEHPWRFGLVIAGSYLLAGTPGLMGYAIYMVHSERKRRQKVAEGGTQPFEGISQGSLRPKKESWGSWFWRAWKSILLSNQSNPNGPYPVHNGHK